MSGAEAAAAVVTFVRDVVITYKSIEDNHTPDPRLAQMCEAARGPYERIVEDVGVSGPLEQEQQALIEGAHKCVERLDTLNRMVSRLAVPESSRRLRKIMAVLGRSVSSMWRKKEVEALEKDLERYQALVDTHLLRHISRQAQISEQQQLKSFAELDHRLKKVLESYNTGDSTIRQFIFTENERMRACFTDTGADITHQLAATELGIRSDINTLENNRLDERARAELERRHKRLLDSLYFPERNARWNRIEENYPKTFGWVFSTTGDSPGKITGSERKSGEYESDVPTAPNFVPWLRSSSKMFWISGKPASGKSTLMKYIVASPKTLEHLAQWRPGVHLIHHSFWKPGVAMQNSVDGMLCSLLYQILEHEPSLAESIGDGFDPAGKFSHHDWSTAELKRTLFRLLKVASAPFCIFLDGLDEAVEQLHKFDIKLLLDGLVKLDGIKICASSRPEPKFAKYFTGAEQLAIHDLTRNDIKTLVQQRLEDMQLDSEFRRELASIVIHRAQGVFMWVILVLNSVHMAIETETPEACLKRVSRMAQDLYSLYQEMWTRETQRGIDRSTATLYFDILVRRRLLFGGADFMTVTLLELSMMTGNNGSLAAAFVDKDEFMPEKTSAQAERTRKLIKLGCAGLLECAFAPDAYLSFNAGPKELQEYASTTVDFTHRTVFDFFTDSEYGEGILAKSPLTDREVFLTTVESVMLEYRHLGARSIGEYMGGTVRGVIRVGTMIKIIECIDLCEINNPDLAEVAEELIEVLCEWHVKGYWHDPIWGDLDKSPTGLPKEPAKIRLFEFVEALVVCYPRMADRFIQRFQASELLDALPMILHTGCRHIGRDNSRTGQLHVVSHTLSRLRELEEAGDPVAQEDLRRIIRLAFSFLLRQAACDIRHSHPKGFLLAEAELRDVTCDKLEAIKSFADLEVFRHDWDQTRAMILGFDFEKDSVVWHTMRFNPSLPLSILVSCNDLFLKNYLAGFEGLRDLNDLGQDASCEPTLNILSVRKNSIMGIQLAKLSAAETEALKEILLQVFVEGRGVVLSIQNQFEELLWSLEWGREATDDQVLDWWKATTILEFREGNYSDLPDIGLPVDLDWRRWREDSSQDHAS